MRSREYHLTPYSSTLIVAKGPMKDPMAFYQYLAKRYDADFSKVLKADPTWAGCCLKVDGTVLVWIADPESDHLINTVSHEAFHAVRKVMQYAGVPWLTKKNEESWAYMQGWITEIVLDFMVE